MFDIKVIVSYKNYLLVAIKPPQFIPSMGQFYVCLKKNSPNIKWLFEFKFVKLQSFLMVLLSIDQIKLGQIS